MIGLEYNNIRGLVVITTIVAVAAVVVAAAVATPAPFNIIGQQQAYAQEGADEDDGSSVNQQIQQVTNPPNGDTKTLDIQSAEPSANSAHRGEISRSLTVDPESEEDDTPANTSVRTIETPNRITTSERQSAPQSSSARSAVGSTFQVTIDVQP